MDSDKCKTSSSSRIKEKQKHLIPDYIDDETSTNSDEIIFPSFSDLKRKTLQALYGLDPKDKNQTYNHSLLMDKSPKGSVDEGIRSLVDLLNAHPSFSTLSSCSGRISLFDPNHAASKVPLEEEVEVEVGDNERTNTGKGYGAWLITSHARIETSQLINALIEQAKGNSNHALIFKHEPLLLHVAASNLVRARQLLTLALNLGFRESGLVVTPKRITVAIRSHSLTLTVPIASRGRLRPNDEFLDELVREANERFDLNVEKLNRLESDVEQSLFQDVDASSGGGGGNNDLDSVDLIATPLPQLNLWGHTVLCMPTGAENENGSVDLITLGGQGTGPDCTDIGADESNTMPQRANGKKKKSSRSNKIYRLRQRSGQWDRSWVEIQQMELNKSGSGSLERVSCVKGVAMAPGRFTAREGSASCILPPIAECNRGTCSGPIAAIFGGRTNPAKPNNELLFMTMTCKLDTDIDTDTLEFFHLQVKGDIPPPRWGHSLTALSGKDGRLAILIGGRDESGVVSSVYILTYTVIAPTNVDTDDDDGTRGTYFSWERVPESIPRFYHSAVAVTATFSISPMAKGSRDEIIILGGLVSTTLVANAEHENNEGDGDDCSPTNFVVKVDSDGTSIQEVDDTTNGTYASSACSLSTGDEYSNVALILTSGGLPCDAMVDSKASPLEVMKIVDADSSTLSIARLDSRTRHSSNNQELSFGSLVHHCCLRLPPSLSNKETASIADAVILGGGVPTFAFGQTFAPSFHVQMYPRDGGGGKAANKLQRLSQTSTKPLSSNANKNKGVKAKGVKMSETTVLYVQNRNAKELKTGLLKSSFLDRNYRMVKVDVNTPIGDPSGQIHIAVPVTSAGFEAAVQELNRYAWESLVVGRGKQVMPFSTAVLGRK